MQVERDFNCIIENAVTFNFANDVVNKEAVRLFHACKNIFGKWAKKSHAYCCIKCSDDHSPDDPNMQIIICDGCCEGIHTQCFSESNNARLLYQQEDIHPFRQDQAYFCSVACFNKYQSISVGFQLQQPRPPLRQLDVEPVQTNSNTVPSSSSALSQNETPAGDTSNLQNEQPASSPALKEGSTGSQITREEPLSGVQSNTVLGKRAHELATTSVQAPPATSQKVAAVAMDAAGSEGQVVRDSLSLVQAMRAARSAEKAHQERFLAAQKTLQARRAR